MASRAELMQHMWNWIHRELAQVEQNKIAI